MRAAGTPLNLSFGVATFGRDGLTLDELTRAADRGLYAGEARLVRSSEQAFRTALLYP